MPLSHLHHPQSPQRILGLVLLVSAIPALWWVYDPGHALHVEPTAFLLWHNCAELVAVLVSLLVFVSGYRALLSARVGAVMLLAVAFLGVGLLDLLHMLSYVGMPDAITPNSPQKSMFFWLAARLMAAFALLAYVALPPVLTSAQTPTRLGIPVVFAVVCATVWYGLSTPALAPNLFVPGKGLTPLKIGLEWTIVGILALALTLLWLRRASFTVTSSVPLGFALALSAVSELFFTLLGIDDRDAANMIGHFYKVAAYLFLFQATFNEALRLPLDNIHQQHVRERLVIDAAPDGVLWIAQDGKILLANPAMERMSGYGKDELIGQDVSIFLPTELRRQHRQNIHGFFAAPRDRAMGLLDIQLLRKDAQQLPVDISLGHWSNRNEHFVVAYVRDLTERKRFEESLRHQATHDELTGLPNRWMFGVQLEQALVRAGRSDTHVAVLLLDLDYFKTVNDSFGHAAGDALLVQVAQRIRGALRQNDFLARLGGDEFAVLLTDLGQVNETARIATTLLAVLQASYQLEGQDIYSGGSLGIAVYPDDARDGDTLLRYADLAMYQAKQAGRGGYACYSRDLDKRVLEDMQLHTRLKEALALGGLRLHYQPQVDVITGAVVGVEALLRWRDAVLGEIPPSRFIPVAEATGLILPLSDWVLNTACAQIATWTHAGRSIRVAVNFSTQQFRQRGLADKIRTALVLTGAQAQWLEVEITESVAMVQPELALEQINAIVALGCRVALDDFGTGYSSLAYLKDLPVNKLKIDKSFIDGIPENDNDATLTRTIIAMAHNLGLTLVAEGVETEAQLAFLRMHGCETYQGWLFAKSMGAPELDDFLSAHAQVKQQAHTASSQNTAHIGVYDI